MTTLYTKSGESFTVPDEYADELGKVNWSLNNGGYFRRGVVLRSRKEARITGLPRMGTELLHRRVMEMYLGRKLKPRHEEDVDHIDRDPSNNLISNLRLAGKLHGLGNINQINVGIFSNNSSGYRGVSYHKGKRKWVAGIRIQGKRIYLGATDTAKEAALLYSKKFFEVYGHEETFLGVPGVLRISSLPYNDATSLQWDQI